MSLASAALRRAGAWARALKHLAGFEHTRPALALAAASPMIAELLSSSAPPLMFFIPWVFCLFAGFYGGAALLAREFALRRGAGLRGMLLMGAAFAILNEGLSAKVFFDPESRSLGPLAAHGRWMGINYIWTIDGILYHAVFSVAIPVLLVYQLFPQLRSRPWLRRRGLWAAGVVFGLTTWVFLAHARPYPTPAAYVWACWMGIAVLVYLGLRPARASAVRCFARSVSPRRFLALGFACTIGLVLQIYVIPALAGTAAALASLAALVVVPSVLLRSWTDRGLSWSVAQQCGLVVGAIGGLAVLALFHELNPTRTYDATGMAVVGAVALGGLRVVWKRGTTRSLTATSTPS